MILAAPYRQWFMSHDFQYVMYFSLSHGHLVSYARSNDYVNRYPRSLCSDEGFSRTNDY